MLSVELVVPFLSAVLVCLMAAYVLQLKRNVGKAQKTISDLIDSLGQEIQGVSHGSMGVGRRLIQVEKEVLALREQLDAANKNDPSKVSYSEAARLVELGAGVDDLMNTCGISRPEAELVKALTSKKLADETESIPVLTPRKH